MRPKVGLLLGEMSEECLHEKYWETTVRSQGASTEIYRGQCKAQGGGSGLMGEGGSAACLTVLSTTTHGLFMGIDGMPQTHPPVLSAQVGER